MTDPALNTVTVVDAFVHSAAIHSLLALQQNGVWTSSVVERWLGTGEVSFARTSETLLVPALNAQANRALRATERRLADRFGIVSARLEPWQIVRYRRGQHYDYHLDAGAWARHPSGERCRTILLILQAPARGGATHFRALGISIKPIAGRLLLWDNLLPSGSCNHAMIHSGRPVWQGSKVILTTWERQRRFLD